jgi:hypothetical protein
MAKDHKFSDKQLDEILSILTYPGNMIKLPWDGNDDLFRDSIEFALRVIL